MISPGQGSNMPELPEVETIRTGLDRITRDHPIIARVRLMRRDLRFPVPKEISNVLKGQRITGVRRRAKYLLIETPSAILLSHLGMTGSWREAPSGDEDKHDHCYIELADGRRLAFCDPRRFGLLDLIEIGQEGHHPRLRHLGPEPLEPKAFTGEYLFEKSRKRKVASKVFIMDQRVVVGVGNIYASEALHRAGIKPQKAAGRLTRLECEILVEDIRGVLREALAAGGSSIRDFRQASGAVGHFQASHLVYARGGEPCRRCATPIRSKVIGGRSTYWCAKCQK